jgi:hypothetical protein
MNLLFIENNGANFSLNRNYRFVLWRIWNRTLPLVMYIGLNPSTANETKPNPTITRLVKMTKNLGYGGFYMLNLFTYVSAYPEELKKVQYTLVDADLNLVKYSKLVQDIVFCWGNFKEAEDRGKEVIKMFPGAYCFGKNKNGSPKHPLYLKSDIKLNKF